MGMTRKTLYEIADITRLSSAMSFDAEGKLIASGNDLLRLDYDPVTLAPQGARIEAATTNLLLTSNDLNSWGKNNCTVVTDAVTVLRGTLALDKIVEDTSSTGHSVERIPTLANATQYVASCFARKGEREALSCWFADTGWATAQQTFFDLVNGVVLTNSNQAAGMIDCGDCWRCWSVQTTASSGTRRVRWMLLDDITTPIAGYTGNGSSGLYVGGCQLEPGAFPSSYIPTASSSASRAADTCSVDKRQWFSAAAGSLLAGFRTRQSSTSKVIAGFGDGSVFVNSVYASKNTDNSMVIGPDAAPTSLGITLPTYDGNEAIVGLTWSAGVAKATLKGTSIVTDSFLFPAVTDLYLGKAPWSASNHLNGTLRNVLASKLALPDAILKTMAGAA